MENKAVVMFYKNNRKISLRGCETIINDYALSKGHEGVKIAICGCISWYNHPDRAAVYVPKLDKVFYYRITYTPHYANKRSQEKGIIQSMTPSYNFTCARAKRGEA